MITGILLDMISMAGKDTSRNAVLFAENKVPFFSRLGEITSEDIAIRIMSSLIASTVTYLLFQFLYSGGAVLTVGLGLGHVQEWRPLFGEFTEIWSLRNTWNKFWHQGMGTSLRVPAHFITVKILRLPKHSLFGGYAYALLVFGLSGLVHVVGDIASGMKFRETSVMHWFLIQALGFVLEDLFIAIYRKITGTRNRHPKNIPTWQKAVGFAWVFSWMLWTLPAWNYPIARKSEGEGVLPFSIVEFLVSGR
ncbi:membrane bound O-acyl transferase family-domain-containing protein [Dendryphion nanum]|uniref:Membrane bound O-acyl transferase family-domain-containing protein n=1 Tax=Dendryphion nanum TaxID=256645 RepID=A0A9P9ICL4_9PLEO|nr:membrane bound O-acyl transferase family-domain-containing protein [Dendryphion nanum]